MSSLVAMVMHAHSHPLRVCIAQHADSEGALLAVKERRSLPSAADVSALRPEMMQNRQDLESSAGSLYDPEEMRRLDEEREEEQKNTDDRGEEVLMEDEQVADFTSSVLAALSCLQYRARALLSHPITTVRLAVTRPFLIPSVPFI